MLLTLNWCVRQVVLVYDQWISLSNIAQGSAVFAYYFIKCHDEREAQISLPAIISAYLGVTEPALFGVNVKYVYPLVAGMSDSALSGLLSTVFGVQANSIGIGGLLAILSIKPQYWGIFAIIMVVDIVVAMVLIFLFHKTGFLTKTEEDGHAQETLKEASEGLVAPTVFTETTEVISPLAGQVKSLSQATDPVFSSGMMGQGLVIEPNQGELVSPVNGTVTVLFPNKHAVGIVSEEGVEMLIHIGMDTVSLDGKGFEAHMNKGIRLLLVKNLSLLIWKRLKVQVLSLKHQLSLQIKMIFKRMLKGIFHVISNVVIFL